MNRHLRTKLNEPSESQLALPFYNLLPKDRAGLLKWRLYLRERALVDADFRKWLMQAFAVDPVFFAVSVIYLHETRNIEGQALGKFPLLPDCDQADLLAWFAEWAGKCDITCSKTRGIGLSYLICILLIWLWLFHGEKIEFAVVTKDAVSLDKKDSPSSLMGKLDLLFECLPAWMQVDDDGNKILDRTVTDHKFRNLKNGNTIGGYVCTDDKLRSGRFYLVVLDEAAFMPADVQRWVSAAHGVSFSIIWISTFDGTSNMFYRISVDDDPTKNYVRLETWWEDNPRWAAGKYVTKNGVVTILDKTYTYPPDYVFSFDDPGIPRSPMIDAAFNRPGADKQRVKEEIYGVVVKDTRKLLSGILHKRDSYVTRPVWRGDYLAGDWVADEDGPISLWTPPNMLTGSYAVGADPSLGALTGAQAGLAAIDVRTGLMTLSARFYNMDGVAFAQKSVAICKALHGPRGAGHARLAWESTGIGQAYSSEISRLRYPAVFMEPGKSTPGCHNADSGEAWLLELGRAISAEDAIIKCGDCWSDFAAWEYDRKFELVFAGTVGHGDVGMAAAIAWRCAADRRRAVRQAIQADSQKHANEIFDRQRENNKKPWSAKFDNDIKRKDRKWL